MVSLTDKGSTLIVIAKDAAWGSENGMLKYRLVAMLSVWFVCFSVLHTVCTSLDHSGTVVSRENIATIVTMLFLKLGFGYGNVNKHIHATNYLTYLL